MDGTTKPDVARFRTVEELKQWVAAATDDEIVAMYEDNFVLSPQQAEYGKELIEAAKIRLEESERMSSEATAAAAD